MIHLQKPEIIVYKYYLQGTSIETTMCFSAGGTVKKLNDVEKNQIKLTVHYGKDILKKL